MLIFALGRRLKKVRLNVAKPGVKIGALMPLHTVCGMGTILFVACATATNKAFLHPTSAPSAFQFMPPPLVLAIKCVLFERVTPEKYRALFLP